MLSSNSSCNYNPFTANQPPINPSSENDISSDIINNSSRLLQQEDNPFSTFLCNFPTSPHTHLEYEDVFQYLDPFSQNQSLTTVPVDNPNPPDEAKDFGIGKPTTIGAAVRKKRCGGSKKDRHSKINTARGPRDRRMRLSLDVARKFFGLQDLLGFDKASRTVDWLLKNSRSAIKELGGEGRRSLNSSASSTTNSDGGGQAATTSSNHSTTVRRASEEPIINNSKQKRVKKMKGVATVRATVGRESRTKARERARERTSQKRRLVCMGSSSKIFAESVLIRGLEKSYPIYDMEQHQPIAELQLSGKPWENYSSFNLPG